MAAGFVTKTVGDGDGGSFPARFWSADTSDVTSPLYPVPLAFDSAGAEVFGLVTANPGATTLLGRIKALLTGTTLAAGEAHLGEVGGRSAVVSYNFNRPANTTPYASGGLVANSTTAASVTPLSWNAAARVAAGTGMVRRARLKTSSTSVANASFRLHLYATDPSAATGITNGDNGAWLTKHAGWMGSFDITVDKVFSDAAAGIGLPTVGSEHNFALASGQTIWGLLEARAAYTPTSAETFTVELEILQN